MNNYLNLSNVDLFKVRVGYGVTGSLPGPNGLSQPGRGLAYDGGQGGAGTFLTRAANPDLKWEEKAETNFGVEYVGGKLSATVDVYTRNIKDFILDRVVDVAEFGVDRRFENAGELKTTGFEAAINYDIVDSADFKQHEDKFLNLQNNPRRLCIRGRDARTLELLAKTLL